MNHALICSDGKPGHENQSIALCRRLGIPFDVVRVHYRFRAAKALSYLFDWAGIRASWLFRTKVPAPDPAGFDLVISTGSTAFYPGKLLARKNKVPFVVVLYPKGYRVHCTAILCPASDRPPKRDRLIELPVGLCAADPGFFEEQAAAFRMRHTPQRPAVGFIIGGPNAVSLIDPESLRRHLEQAFALTEGYERWVTTSRRTPPEVEAVIESLPFEYKLIHSRDPYNPVPAFIHLCERLFVTGDSMSMISECVSFGKAAVEVIPTRALRSPNKFERFIASLDEEGAVHLFDGTIANTTRKIDLTQLLEERLRPLLAH